MTDCGNRCVECLSRSLNFRFIASVSLLVLCLALPLSSSAEVEPSPNVNIAPQIEERIFEGNASSRVEVSQNLDPRGSRAQELRRLWALAMAYARSDRPRAALPYLEKLVSLAPENPTYRVELAAALERAGHVDRARYHYNLTRGAGLDADLEGEIYRRIDRIDRGKFWEGHFAIAWTPESNAARRTAADTISIGDLAFRLRPEAQAKAAQGVKLNFGVAALPALAPDFRARLGVSTESRLFEGDTPDDVQATMDLGLIHFGDRSRRIGAGLLFGKRWINGAEYSKSKGGYLSWGRSLGAEARSGVSITVLHELTTFDDAPLRTTTRNMASLRLTHLVSSQMQLNLGVSLEQNESRLKWETGDRMSLNIGTRYAFRGGLLMDLELSTAKLTRDAPDPLFGVTRKDDRHIAQIKLIHRDWAMGGFVPVLELGIEKQRSTNRIYSYDNTRTALGLTRQF